MSTNGERSAHEVKPGDSPHLAALKKEWIRLDERETAEGADHERLSRIARSWQGQSWAAQRRLEETRQQKERVKAALTALQEGAA